MAAPVPRHERSELFRILDGDGGRKVLETANLVGDVKEEVAEEVSECDFEAGHDLGQIELFPESQFGSLDNSDRH
jgi:hypothetical protein